jgi:transcriptional regulator with XRE-family HTH domain
MLILNRPKFGTKGALGMVNKNLFLSAMVKAGFSQKTLAKKLEMSKNTLSAKINGKGFFDTKQIDLVCQTLNINDDHDKIEIFLSESSQKRDDVQTG